MEKLNHECLEHIFGYLNCGAKEWLILAKVCMKWKDVVARFWKRVNSIEINNECYVDHNLNNSQHLYLSTKNVMEILEFTAQHVKQVKIIEWENINHIVLGNRVYLLNGLDMDAFYKSFAEYSEGQVVKVQVLLDNLEFLEYLMKSNQDLEELHLVLDDDCFEYLKVSPGSKYKLRKIVNIKKNCVKLFEKIFSSFPKLKSLDVSIKKYNTNSFDVVDGLLSSLLKSASITNFHISSSYYIPELLSLSSRRCTGQSLDQGFRGRKWIYWTLRFTLSSSMEPVKEFLKMTSMTIDFTHINLSVFRMKEEVENFKNIQRFFNKIIPSLEKLNIVCEDNGKFDSCLQFSYARISLVNAVNSAILCDRKVVFNNKIEIVKNDGVQRGDAQALAVTWVYVRDKTEMLRDLLQKTCPNCLFTVKL